jgi:hypothetical protein
MVAAAKLAVGSDGHGARFSGAVIVILLLPETPVLSGPEVCDHLEPRSTFGIQFLRGNSLERALHLALKLDQRPSVVAANLEARLGSRGRTPFGSRVGEAKSGFRRRKIRAATAGGFTASDRISRAERALLFGSAINGCERGRPPGTPWPTNVTP